MPSYKKTAEKLIVSFTGNLDTATCIDFECELYEQIEKNPDNIVFDLNDAYTISSMFLRVCTKTAQKIGKEKFLIINTPEQAMKIFTLTRLNSFLNISAKTL
jgi:anti-anti-sigma factor